jgi:hypothetical protein
MSVVSPRTARFNAAVLRAAQVGGRLDLWFLDTDDRHAIEADLIFRLQPPWNGRR